MLKKEFNFYEFVKSKQYTDILDLLQEIKESYILASLKETCLLISVLVGEFNLLFTKTHIPD